MDSGLATSSRPGMTTIGWAPAAPYLFFRFANALNAAIASSDFSRSPNRWASWSMRRVSSSGAARSSLRESRDRLGRQPADIARHLARLDLGMSRRDHGVDEACRVRLRGGESSPHHQHREGALVAHRVRHQEAGRADRNEPEMDIGRGEGRGVRGKHIVAMEQHHGAHADRGAVDGRDDRLDVEGERIEKFCAVRQRLGIRFGLHEVVDVVAGGEHAGAAGDDHAADVGIVLRGVDRAAHLAIHVLRDRVLLARAAQGDDARSALFGDDDIAIRHESPLRSPRRLPWRVSQASAYIILQACQSARSAFSRTSS
ncbi:hypothetical protein ACVWXQ_008357 [Bradyrhizobium sp. S3.14.4]